MHEARGRDATVMFFVTVAEKNEIRRRATAHNMTISRYCRDLALGKLERTDKR